MEQSRVRSIKCALLAAAMLAGVCGHPQGNFGGGFVGGFTTSQVDGDEHDGFHRIGAYAGGFVEFGLAERPLTHTFELAFSQKGAASARKDFKTTVAYADATYLLGIRPARFGSNPIPEALRLSVGVAASAKVSESIAFGGVKNSAGDFNRVDLQATAGVGYEILKHLEAETRVAYSAIPNGGRYFNFTLFFALRWRCFGG